LWRWSDFDDDAICRWSFGGNAAVNVYGCVANLASSLAVGFVIPKSQAPSV
jgi:hypothetical protein